MLVLSLKNYYKKKLKQYCLLFIISFLLFAFDIEQKCYELDKKFIESASRLDSESSQNEKATARCNDLGI